MGYYNDNDNNKIRRKKLVTTKIVIKNLNILILRQIKKIKVLIQVPVKE